MMQITKAKRLQRIVERSLLVAVMIVGGSTAQAHSGDLDNHFGTGGAAVVTLPITDSIWDSFPMTTAVDATNRALVAFYLLDADCGLLTALDADGNLDTTFGTAGYVRSPAHSFVFDMRVDSKNRIVTLEKWDAVASPGLRVVRRLADGTFDSSFGIGGFTDPGALSTDFQAEHLVIGRGDDIYIAGTEPFGSEQLVAVAKFNVSGAIDPSFGTLGVASVRLLPTDDFSEAKELGIGPDGGLFAVADTASVSAATTVGSLLKLDSTGKLDPSFAGAGVAPFIAIPTTTSGAYTLTSSIAFDSAGNIVVAGQAGDAFGIHFSVVGRFTASGVFDSAFNSGSILMLSDSTYAYGGRVTALVDGRDRIVVSGSASNSMTYEPSMVAFRFNGDGTTDSSFGAGSGRVITGSIAGASRSSLTHDGGLLVFGDDLDTGGSFGTIYKLIGYDLPPILPPEGF